MWETKHPIKPLLLLLLTIFSQQLTAQLISGTVYDSTKLYGVKGVIVRTNSGNFYITDSTGAYHINTTDKDSIYFQYANKPTQKFAVWQIADHGAFDISLPVRVQEKYKTLKGVVIFSRSYKQDSIANRVQYSKAFDYHKPGLSSTMSPGTPPGLDIGELIRIFQFRRNKQRQAFQDRLIAEEQEKYVNAKFNAPLLKRITGLSGDQLQLYRTMYRPPYEFAVMSSELQFYEYILNSSYEFKKMNRL